MKLEGAPFTNSDTCRGEAFTSADAPLDLAVIEINGRYPETGWALNRTVHEMVRVQTGLGSLAIKNGDTTELSAGDVVSVPLRTSFAWSGDMTLLMACSPAFSVEQYELIDGQEKTISADFSAESPVPSGNLYSNNSKQEQQSQEYDRDLVHQRNSS